MMDVSALPAACSVSSSSPPVAPPPPLSALPFGDLPPPKLDASSTLPDDMSASEPAEDDPAYESEVDVLIVASLVPAHTSASSYQSRTASYNLASEAPSLVNRRTNHAGQHIDDGQEEAELAPDHSAACATEGQGASSASTLATQAESGRGEGARNPRGVEPGEALLCRDLATEAPSDPAAPPAPVAIERPWSQNSGESLVDEDTLFYSAPTAATRVAATTPLCQPSHPSAPSTEDKAWRPFNKALAVIGSVITGHNRDPRLVFPPPATPPVRSVGVRGVWPDDSPGSPASTSSSRRDTPALTLADAEPSIALAHAKPHPGSSVVAPSKPASSLLSVISIQHRLEQRFHKDRQKSPSRRRPAPAPLAARSSRPEVARETSEDSIASAQGASPHESPTLRRKSATCARSSEVSVGDVGTSRTLDLWSDLTSGSLTGGHSSCSPNPSLAYQRSLSPVSATGVAPPSSPTPSRPALLVPAQFSAPDSASIRSQPLTDSSRAYHPAAGSIPSIVPTAAAERHPGTRGGSPGPAEPPLDSVSRRAASEACSGTLSGSASPSSPPQSFPHSPALEDIALGALRLDSAGEEQYSGFISDEEGDIAGPQDLQLGGQLPGSPALQSLLDARQSYPRASGSSANIGPAAVETTEIDSSQIEALRLSANVSLQDIFSSFPPGTGSHRDSQFDYTHTYNASTSTVGGGLDPVLDAFPAPRLSRSNSDLRGPVVYSEGPQKPTERLPYPRWSNGIVPLPHLTASMSTGLSSTPRESELASLQPTATPQGYSHNSTAPITAPRFPAYTSSSDALHHPEGARGSEGRLRGRRHSFGPSARPDSAQGSVHSASTSSHPSRLRRFGKEEEALRGPGSFVGTDQQVSKKSGKGASAAAAPPPPKPKKSKRREFLGLDLTFGHHSASRNSSQKSASRSLVGFRRDHPGTGSPTSEYRSGLSGPTGESPQLQYTMAGPSNISTVERDEEKLCPVCLEPLAMRMRGEKPPVTPVCGHGLHASCFEAVYGPMERARSEGGNLGLCGVCRRDMKLGDDTEGPMAKTGKSKFAAMAGIPGRDNGSTTFDSHKVRSISRRTLASDANGAGQSLHDPAEDDELVDEFTQPMPQYRSLGHRNSADTLQAMGGASSPMRGRSGSASGYVSSRGGANGRAYHEPEVAQPRITVVSESPTLTRSSDRTKAQHITCMVTVEMPSKYPGQQLPVVQEQGHTLAHRDSVSPTLRSGHSQISHHLPSWPSLVPPPNVDRSPTFDGQRPDSPSHSSGRSSGLINDHIKPEEPGHGALQGVVDDLRARMHDWKGHDPDTFGRLHLFDFLSVRKNDQSRQFLLYLFAETLLCVDENKRLGPKGQPVEKQLRLRGRVYARHISRVEETSPSPSDLTLTVEMEQKDLDAFVISFTDRSTLEVWREKICQLVERQKAPRSTAGRGSIMSENTEHTRVTNSSSEGGYPSSAFTRHTYTTGSSAPPLSSVGEEDEMSYSAAKMSMRPMAHSRDAYPYHTPNASIGSLGGPREFTPIDLMLVLSVPVPSSSAPSSYSLKLRLIRQALDFVINSVGPRARISIVTFSAGEGARAQLRKTPFLAVGREDGRRRLQRVLEEIGQDGDSRSAPGTLGMIEHAEEKTSVVTAVNLALDIILQRKQKSPLTGILLMNDARDYSSKSHMSLVMARAEQANAPIHTFGWSKTHDPSSLWQLSHHTGGTYTFIQDWYSLKDCFAGCIGAMLSIAMTSFRLYISVPERRWFRIRKIAGINSVILASDGKNADIDVSELRYGEKRELLVEMEMLAPAHMHNERRPTVSTATDEFFLRRTGINPMSMDDLGGNLYDAEFDDLVDEVPLFEVDASYRDPAVGKQVSRLPYPVLLTVTVAPPNPPGVRSPVPPPEPSIVRRRIEILASDAMTRALLLLSRNNEANARQLLSETRRIIHALMSNLGGDPGQQHSPPYSRRGQTAAQTAHDVLAGCAEDLGVILQGLSNRAAFDRLERNFAAQQAVVLREQKAWTGRTATERAYWTSDNSLWFAAQSARYVGAA